MERKITEQLIAWKTRENRKPLIIQGARQVGKTYTIKEFGKHHFKEVFYINFETDIAISADFQNDITPKNLISKIEVYFNTKIDPTNCLLFFDEIQANPRALTSLKYFNENASEYFIIAAGSLLGVAIHRENYSFPVGQVEFLTLNPLDFEEYLWALGRNNLSEMIREQYIKMEKMPLHEMAISIYKTYLVTGGMPEVVTQYVEQQSLVEIQPIQNAIVNSYIADMAKYAKPTETTKIMSAFRSIPTQLAKDNTKFQFKVIQKGGSATIFGNSIDWLCASNIVYKCQNVEKGIPPLAAYQNLSSFKIYMSDIGLLTHISGFPAHLLVTEGVIQHPFIGAIAENYVANNLINLGFPLYYWTSDNTAEIDFVVQNSLGEIIPIEVKSNINVKSRSLSVYKNQYNPKYSIRISSKNFGFENGIKSIPLYACFCLEMHTLE